MDERDFQAMQNDANSNTVNEDCSYPVSMCNLIEFLNEQISPKITPAPSWYDIYRYAKYEYEWYENERARLVSTDAKVDDINNAMKQSNFFEEIKEIAGVQMLNACLRIAKTNGIKSPFNDEQKAA